MWPSINSVSGNDLKGRSTTLAKTSEEFTAMFILFINDILKPFSIEPKHCHVDEDMNSQKLTASTRTASKPVLPRRRRCQRNSKRFESNM